MSRIAIERSEEKRAAYRLRIGRYEPEQIVSVDESSSDRRIVYKKRV
jgi:hypothetical protein